MAFAVVDLSPKRGGARLAGGLGFTMVGIRGAQQRVSLEVDTWRVVQIDTVVHHTVVMGILSESAGP